MVQNLAWLLVAATQIPQYCVEGWISPNSVNCFTSMTTFTRSGVEIASDALNIVHACAYLHRSPSSSRLLAAKSLANASGQDPSHAPERSTLPAPPWALKWWLNNQGSANPPPGYGSNSNSGVPGNLANSQAECAFQSLETIDDILTIAMDTWALSSQHYNEPRKLRIKSVGPRGITSQYRSRYLQSLGQVQLVLQDLGAMCSRCG